MGVARIGLALGSGSARGWSHIGVIEALAEAGIEPDIVCGTSMGALVGAAHVAGRAAALKEWAEAATWREIGALLDVRFTGGGLIDGARVQGLLKELGISDPIESYDRPFAAVATDFETGREIWLREGAIDRAVRASIALPGIFSPVEIDGKWLIDGGLVNPVPVSTCRALGADFIIAVNLNGELLGRRVAGSPVSPSGSEAPPQNGGLAAFLEHLPAQIRHQAAQIAPKLIWQGPKSPGYFDVLANSINIMQDQITRTRLAGEPPHALLLPRLRDMRLMDFHRAGEAIAEGRAAAEMALPGILRQLGLTARYERRD